MDLYAAESKKIQSLIQDWISHPEQELEATFGAGGAVDATTFLNIAQRLRAKGYEPLPQDDRLSIITPNQIRLSLQGLGVLQGYCRDNILKGKPYTAMIKDRTSKDSNVDLEEYECRIKSRREINLSPDDPRIREMLDNWGILKKAYRLIRRWTFKGNGMRIDMSIVRSSPKDNRGEFRWSRAFQEFNIFRQAPIYEVEVELLHEDATNTPESATKCLIRGIGEILRAIQKNTLLIRKSIKEKVFAGYAALNGSDRFRGVAPITIERANMIATIDPKIPNIRTGYNVTDKADGLRCLGYCDSKGELFLIDMGMNIYRTGLRNNTCADSLLDGEWVTKNKDGKAINHFLLFDIYRAAGKNDVSQFPFTGDDGETRWEHLRTWIGAWTAEGKTEVIAKGVTDAVKLQVAMKTFLIAKGDEPKTIFTACNRILDTLHIYNTDGLILSPNAMPLPAQSGATFYEQFKWKPALDNTIDFLVNFEKDAEIPTLDKVTNGIQPSSGETLRFKTLRLYVGSVKDTAFDDPRATILNKLPLPDPRRVQGKAAVYKPVLFNPADYPDTMSNTCYRPTVIDTESGEDMITTEHGEEPIQDRSIVEMRYDPLQEPGWRWIPIRIRHDKTERLLRGQIARTLNSEKVANSVWNSIHDPITESMIRTGSEEPTEAEVRAIRKAGESDVGKVYYDRTAQKEDLLIVRGMRDFHNRYIKGDLLYDCVLQAGGKGGKTIVDLACGKAGDLQKWRNGKAAFVLGVDTAGDNIRDANNGAYRRYLDTLSRFGPSAVPPMVFVIGNSSKLLINGEAGATPEERDILRSVFARQAAEGPVPKLISTESAGSLKNGADVAVCMFALHYFFENIDVLNGFIQNLSDCVKPGGYFMGCCFDGLRVFNMLQTIETGRSKVGMEGDVPIWSIRKEYAKDELTDDDASVGMAIDVEFISIGTEHREYLVSFEYLKRRLRAIGFEIMTVEESRAIGLKNSTNLFEESYATAAASGKKYAMTAAVKEFSFLNRWFVFKRRAMTEIKGEEEVGEATRALAMAERTAATDAEVAERSISIAPREGADAEVMDEVAEKLDADKGVVIAEKVVAEKAVATFRLPPPDATFNPAEIFLFGTGVAAQDTLKIKDTGAGRWLAPTALFPIRDPEEIGIEYPSVSHFMAGMTIKHGGKNPAVAMALFSNAPGSIHSRFEDIRRLKAGKGGKLSDADYYEVLKDEIAAVMKALMPKELAPYRVTVDKALWSGKRDDMLREALKQRWDRDARFHKIVEAARDKKKYLLYYVGTAAGGELSGVRRTADGRIDGENKMGRFIMEIAGFHL
jgi:SAM-dependent methyltransferase